MIDFVAETFPVARSLGALTEKMSVGQQGFLVFGGRDDFHVVPDFSFLHPEAFSIKSKKPHPVTELKQSREPKRPLFVSTLRPSLQD
jgi:hypothetical protein